MLMREEDLFIRPLMKSARHGRQFALRPMNYSSTPFPSVVLFPEEDFPPHPPD